MIELFEVPSSLSYAFSDQAIRSVRFENFDTSSVTDMNGIFLNCYGLTSLDLSGFDTSSVTNMSYMFRGCSSLSSLRIPKTKVVFNYSPATPLYDPFYGIPKMTLYYLAGYDPTPWTRYMKNGYTLVEY